ncbi:TPR-like protein [Panus rudis PR-1116 ss-1]|nr:TPR-like protein [Panus rudis PR-1116 ss-1]
MSAFVKNKLKEARDAITKKDYAKAQAAASTVLEYDPDNYNANVFLGVAYLELREIEKSEQAYRKAIESSPDQILAWQGLSKLYERTEKWDKYAEVLQNMAWMFLKAQDAVKCAETLQKFIELRRSKGTPLQVADVLALLLPESKFYPLLSTLPAPDPTNPTGSSTFETQIAMQNSLPILEEIVSILEQHEEETIKNEIAKRRTRLNASGPEQLKREVGREVWGPSKLPALYNEIMNHPNTSDELRRQTESKLLRHKQQLLYALPATGQHASEKARLRTEVQEMINGMVLISVPDELAWALFIEWKDVETIEGYDLDILRKYMLLFPTTSLSKLLHAYFGYAGILLSEDSDDDESQKEEPVSNDDVDYMEAIVDAFNNSGNLVVAHRIVAEVYENEEDLENAIKVAESGLELVIRHEKNVGSGLPLVAKAFNVILGVALVDLYPPKHHARALGILDEVLAQDADNVRCLMGRAYVLQYAKKWSDAAELFSRVVQLIPDDMDDGLRAREELAWCKAQSGDPDGGAKALREVLDTLDTLEGREHDQARCWWRLGKCYWDIGDATREDAYQHFITSLKRDPAFAPAFTSLGIYYSEFASPPDPKRAAKCFQKAFELDPREGEAARRLAEGFAEDREWDLVEVVARRTIDGEGGMDGGVDSGPPARYLPLNAWAWKAIGVVDLNRQQYGTAIQAFQIALRTDVDDQLSWLRLGEAYSKAGRYAAALKALNRARELDANDWIASYFIGEVQRQMGHYDEAIAAFEDILKTQPAELGVLISLAQTHLQQGRAQFATAYTARAEASYIATIQVVMRLMESSPGFRILAWKLAGDALFCLSQLMSYADDDLVADTVHQVTALLRQHPQNRLDGIVSFASSPDGLSGPSLSLRSLEMAIASYDYRATLGSLDDIAGASCHFDLATTLTTYARRIIPGPKQDRVIEAAISSYKEAISLDPTNDEFWHAFANACFSSQPRVAQHAFIKALEIDSKKASTWTDLGLFYLHHEDPVLANEAFYKAQILDPDYSLAWVGQGLVATVNGHDKEAMALFEHAVGLTSPVPGADVEFAKRLFKTLGTAGDRTSPDSIYPAFFVLDRYVKQHPQDANALHLFSLVCESIGQRELAVDLVQRAITILETAYEESEDPIIERQFTIAHTNLGRLRLSLQDYDGALEAFQVALGLLPEDDPEQTTRVLLSEVHFGSGLASFKLGRFEEALVSFETALESSADHTVVRGHVTVLLAQTLWALGTEEGRESAKAQLLQSISSDPENLIAVNTLAGMGILTDDDSLVDAALSEILALPLQERLERDPEGHVSYLLIQHHLGQGDVRQAISVAQAAVAAQPWKPGIRRRLASLLLRSGDAKSALAILESASTAEEHDLYQARESLGLQAIAYAQTADGGREAHRLAQKSVMLQPAALFNWQALAYTRNVSNA